MSKLDNTIAADPSEKESFIKIEGDLNADGKINDKELEFLLEFKRKELEDRDAQRDAIRKMAWFSLWGLLFYPVAIAVTIAIGLDKAASLIADIAPTYFASIAVLVSAFFATDAVKQKNKNQK